MHFNLTPAEISDIEWIAELESGTYSGIDVIPYTTLAGWYRANPDIFYIIRDDDGHRVGHIDVLPLRADALQRFIQGAIIERDITGEDIFTASEKGQIADLYIESVAIPYLKGYARACALRDALTGISMIINNLCYPDVHCTLYAMPASNEGLRLMERMGFRLLVDGHIRKDQHSLYAVSFMDFNSQR